MPKTDPVKESLARLAEWDMSASPSEADKTFLKKCINGNQGMVAARAAKRVADLNLMDWAPLLAQTFDRFVNKPKLDPGCQAKESLVEALNTFEWDDIDLFERGVRYVQMEPVWGKSVDTAGNLRVKCAGGLIRLHHPSLMYILTDLLVDRQVEARLGAARAIVHSGKPEGELLLRLKILQHADEPEVLSECLGAMAQYMSPETIPFLKRCLTDPDEIVAQGAALALGETRTVEATKVLIDHWNNTLLSDRRKTLALPIALTRTEEAIGFLIATIREAHWQLAVEALHALESVGLRDAVYDQVKEAAQASEDDAVMNAFLQVFEEET